jgi:hypothetical protein
MRCLRKPANALSAKKRRRSGRAPHPVAYYAARQAGWLEKDQAGIAELKNPER